MPTMAEFLATARKQGVRRKIGKTRVVDPDGNELPIAYLSRKGYPPLIHPQLRPTETLTPIVLGNLCRRLGVDPSPLGFSLDDLPPDDML